LLLKGQIHSLHQSITTTHTNSTYYYIFTVAPAIFMLKTAFWCMGWGACTFIFVKGLLECKSVYDL